jgi:ThiF family
MPSKQELELGELLSRPVRSAAKLVGNEESVLERLFSEASVLIRLEDAFSNSKEARETFLFAVNQICRFCPNVFVRAPAAPEMTSACAEIVSRIHGGAQRIQADETRDAARFTAVVNVGTEILRDANSVTVNSTGWVARVATRSAPGPRLFWSPGRSNPIGALAAGCFGAAHAFRFVIAAPVVQSAAEVSLFSYEFGMPGSLSVGPELPAEPVRLDAFLVGCGAVANGWAYTVKRLPIFGYVEAIDRQSLSIENLGPYVAADREWLGKPKAAMIASFLEPAITVTPRCEEWELFKLRLLHGLSTSKLIVNGLDNVETRHSVQRLWPETLIDMASGGQTGLTSQVILKPRSSDRICLLQALDRPANEIGWAERAARGTGLKLERILQAPTSAITDSDVSEAPEEQRPALELARQQGMPLCGRIADQNLRFERRDAGFAPAVPFATGFSGVVGAAATMKWLMSPQKEHGFHFQFSFASMRGRKHEMRCSPDCECQTEASEAAVIAAR